MLLYDLIRTALCEYDDNCVENFINENYEKHDNRNVHLSTNDIIIKFKKWYKEPDCHISLFKWNGQYWKDGEKKLEYICQIHCNQSTMNQDLRKIKKLESLNEYKRFYAFDLFTGEYLKNESSKINNFIKFEM